MEAPTTINKILIPKSDSNKSQELLETLKSISSDDITTLEQAVNNKEPIHDIERAKKALYDTSNTLEHYKNYEEALEIISNSKEPITFMQF